MTEFIFEIYDITGTEIILRDVVDQTPLTLNRDLLPYVTLPSPNDSIVNLRIGDRIRLNTFLIKK
jgi:hypothetical protein